MADYRLTKDMRQVDDRGHITDDLSEALDVFIPGVTLHDKNGQSYTDEPDSQAVRMAAVVTALATADIAMSLRAIALRHGE